MDKEGKKTWLPWPHARPASTTATSSLACSFLIQNENYRIRFLSLDFVQQIVAVTVLRLTCVLLKVEHLSSGMFSTCAVVLMLLCIQCVKFLHFHFCFISQYCNNNASLIKRGFHNHKEAFFNDITHSASVFMMHQRAPNKSFTIAYNRNKNKCSVSLQIIRFMMSRAVGLHRYVDM